MYFLSDKLQTARVGDLVQQFTLCIYCCLPLSLRLSCCGLTFRSRRRRFEALTLKRFLRGPDRSTSPTPFLIFILLLLAAAMDATVYDDTASDPPFISTCVPSLSPSLLVYSERFFVKLNKSGLPKSPDKTERQCTLFVVSIAAVALRLEVCPVKSSFITLETKSKVSSL